MRGYVVALVLLAGCGFDVAKARDDAGADAADSDAASGLGHCLGEPGIVVRVPSGRLPCDLLPPGFTP